MRIYGFAGNKGLINTMFISLALHLFYFSCIMFTFDDKINYPINLPTIDFLGSILRESDILVDGQIIGDAVLFKNQERFLALPEQSAQTEQNHSFLVKPYFKTRYFTSEKLPTKLIGVDSANDYKTKINAQETVIINKAIEWDKEIKLKVDDKN